MRQFLLVVLIAACGANPSDTVVPDPGNLPPLPPDPSTSVGLLIENRSQLGLSDQQVALMSELENELQAQNKAIDRELEDMEERRSNMRKRRKAGSGADPGGRAGGGAGAMGGRRGGGGGPPGGGMGGPPGGGPGGNRPDPEAIRRAHQEMATRESEFHAKKAENNRLMLERAWQILEPAQRIKARAILDENGHDAPSEDDVP